MAQPAQTRESGGNRLGVDVGRTWMRVLLPVALGIAAACLVLLRQAEFGPGLTADSAIFVSTARNVFAGADFVPVFGEYSSRPPLYPLIIAATGFLHSDMIAAAGVLNAVAFGLSVFLLTAWLRRRQVSPALVAWAGLALALSPVAGAAAYVWSESVFVLFVLAALFSLDRFLVAGGRRALLVSAGFAALCCLTRYAGASVLVCAIVFITARRQWPPTKRFGAATVYAAVATAPIVLWLARNLLVMDSLTGDRSQIPHFTAMPMFHMVVEMMLGTIVGPTVLDWIQRLSAWLGVVPGKPTIAGAGAQLICLLAVCGLIAGVLARWRRTARGASVLAGFVVCYLGLLAVVTAWAGLDAEARYAAPLIAPMLALCALALHACASPMGANWLERGPRWRRWLVGAALSLWLAQWVAPDVAEVRQWRAHGGDGYGARRWADSATMASLRSGAHDEGLLLSNDPFAVYLLTGGGTATHRSGDDRIGRLPWPIAPKTDVAWLYAPRVPRNTDLMAFLGAFPNMRTIATYADGIIFQQGQHGDKDDVDAAVARLAAALLRHARRGELVAASRFNVYWNDGDKRLTYVRQGCKATDVRAGFYLHVTPEDPANRTWWAGDVVLGQPVSVDFHNLDFRFASRGVHGDVCIATHALPGYAIAEVRTGQWGPQGEIWSTRFTLPPERREHDL